MRLVDVLAAFWRRWPIILGCILVCAVVAATYSKLTTKMYRASTLISVTAAKFDYGNGLAAQGLLANYALQITGQDLLKQLDQSLQLDKSPAQLQKMITATPDNTTLTISVDVDDTEAQRAADIANGITNLFVTYIQQVNQAQLNPDVDVSVLQQAATPSAPNKPKTKTNTLAGALLGLLIGCGAAYLFDVWDDRLRGVHDVEAGLDLPLLGSVPHFRAPPAKAGLPASDDDHVPRLPPPVAPSVAGKG